MKFLSFLRQRVAIMLINKNAPVRKMLWRSRTIRWGYYRSLFPLRYWLWSDRQSTWLTGRSVTIVFLPQLPETGHVISKIVTISGYQITNHVRKDANLVIRWFDGTYPENDKRLDQFGAETPILNRQLTDISKKLLDEVHKEVFGYGVSIDPFKFRGLGVKKSDENSKHDGEVIEFPITKLEPGFVYQKCVDNQIDDTYVQDIRVPIIGDSIPFVYLRHRPVSDRFGVRGNEFSLIAETQDHLSQEEQESILQLCRRMGLDFGEVDVLRDRGDQKIYIVDLNNTPSGPVKGLKRDDYWRAIQRLTSAFNNTFLSR